jgi:CheY-like chemotaxis protein
VTVRAGLSAWERERGGAGEPRSGKCLRVSVADTGIGIQPKDQERVFLEFEQADSSYARQQHGTGLGLSLTRKLVELHGGWIWVESEGIEGKGSNFIFLLPIDTEEVGRAAPKELKAEEASRARATAERNLAATGPLVLIVEDERQAGELLEEYLTSDGYAVAHAWDGEEAIRLARQLRPHAITLDILLPKKSGWEVLAELRAMPETKDIPVVVVSITDDLQLGFSLGAVEYFVKPVSKDRLLEAVHKARNAAGKEVQKVLVIDDEPITVEFLTSTIHSAGFNVIPANGGREGVELAVLHKPDLIILDLIMPEVNGFEVVQRLRARPDTREIPILVYTAKDLTESERQGLIQHVQAIASKSGKEDLLRELNRLARLNRESRRAA